MAAKVMGRISLTLEYGKPKRTGVREGPRFQRRYGCHEVTECTDRPRVMGSVRLARFCEADVSPVRLRACEGNGAERLTGHE